MAWANQPEMPPVQRRQLGLVQPFNDGQHGGINEADVGVGIAAA
jgi:hypothetical protein